MTRLKYLRLSNDWTQCDIEKKARRKIKRWRIALAENGLSLLTNQELAVLGEVFNVEPARLLEELDLTN